MIVFSTMLGIMFGEWKGVSSRTRGLLAASLGLIVAALVMIGYANKLEKYKPAVPKRWPRWFARSVERPR